MYDDSPGNAQSDAADGALPKVVDLPITDLIRSEDSAFFRALQRLAQDNDRRNDHYAAHSSTP